MQRYYAIFYPMEDEWGVRFPDALSVNTSGKDIDEALEMAMDALSAMLVFGRKGREYQEPRGFEAIQAEAKEGELVFPVTPTEKAMEAYRPKKRINVMIPVDLLNRVGEALKDQKGLDRSKFICNAVEKRLNEGVDARS
ncbi:HicB_like antitoxin of toxin-antitoxin system [Desulfocicer vacuolatum DSM 3385]|uniref:HicB_like antitoxin of toxin-antitoxin system n=1 Tax=Desulfocicer vacuolatum DSM 3385 TaxID=1121400 RepID=A0A1W2D357_9BACT|nr:type II toxin-antitoxin system HicB family antitoxin [Desulfocicer vacuolatum]SMC92015.1 HicB_like antitoxin of toxin-antitoxin system [Desulfocicer vacuolatum DSM 3385]